MLYAFSIQGEEARWETFREPNRKRNAEPSCGMTPVAVAAFEGSACAGAVMQSCDRGYKKGPIFGAFVRADDGSRTHDLLHGKRVVVRPRGSPVARR